MPFKLLTAFEALFKGQKYLHRSSHLGDWVSMHLYEDLFDLAKARNTSKIIERITSGTRVISTSNRRVGVKSRRGDGSFGEIVPGTKPIWDSTFAVARGFLATVEIGAEVKIASKAMIKQVDRVVGDLTKQVGEFKKKGKDCVCVGIVGVNHAPFTTSYEGDRAFRTDGKKYTHPASEAPSMIRELNDRAALAFDEFLILKYSAVNEDPYPFSWVNQAVTEREYGAALLRISDLYISRF